MLGKDFPFRTLPGGRRVRDYSDLTVAELTAAVGNDQSAAELALEQETDSPKPRKTAVDRLSAVAKAEDE